MTHLLRLLLPEESRQPAFDPLLLLGPTADRSGPPAPSRSRPAFRPSPTYSARPAWTEIRTTVKIRMGPLQMPATPPRSEGILLRPFQTPTSGCSVTSRLIPYVPLIGSLPANASEQEALDFIERQHNRLETGVGYSFCVAELAGDAALGTAGLWIADLAKGRATVGFTVAPFARRRGVAVKALGAVTAFGWTLSDLFRIELYVEPSNVG